MSRGSLNEWGEGFPKFFHDFRAGGWHEKTSPEDIFHQPPGEVEFGASLLTM